MVMNLNRNRSRVNMLNFGHFMSLREAQRRSNDTKKPFCPRERLP